MNKTISMSIRVSEEELDKLKQAARLEAYASYSEFMLLAIDVRQIPKQKRSTGVPGLSRKDVYQLMLQNTMQ